MKNLGTAVCAVAFLAAAPAFAGDNPAWTYGQVQYQQSTSGDDTADAIGIAGSLGIADLFHVQAEFASGNFGTSGDDDYDRYSIIAGVHPAVGPNTDAVFNIRYSSMDPDDSSDDLDAWGVGAGLRHMLTDKFELNGMINWDRYSEDNSSDDLTAVSWTVGGRYLMTPNVSAGVSYTDFGNVGGSIYSFAGGAATIDVRYQFGDVL